MAGPRSILYANFHPCAGNAMFRRRLDGIRRFARGLGLEVATLGADDCGPDGVTEALERLRPAGCIAESANLSPRMFGSIPAVFFDPPDKPEWRRVRNVVRCDDAEVAEVAFRELSAGLPPVYAVVSYWMLGCKWAANRAIAFRECCRKAGVKCLAFPVRRGEDVEARAVRLDSWVAALPPRCAIFAVNDAIAQNVARALRAARRFMPHDATLVGANGEHDGDDAAADISSVKIDFELSGYLAAKTLLGFLATKNTKKHKEFVNSVSSVAKDVSGTFGPLLVERRKSTRGRGRKAPFVMEAIDIIRREACGGLTAAKLARRFKCSRNLIERRFREATGRSVLNEILDVRLARVVELLARPDIPVSAIADFTGFPSGDSLYRLFRKRFKMSMRDWRAMRE